VVNESVRPVSDGDRISRRVCGRPWPASAVPEASVVEVDDVVVGAGLAGRAALRQEG
jgi:hypothetical protein